MNTTADLQRIVVDTVTASVPGDVKIAEAEMVVSTPGVDSVGDRVLPGGGAAEPIPAAGELRTDTAGEERARHARTRPLAPGCAPPRGLGPTPASAKSFSRRGGPIFGAPPDILAR